ncbi:hypothetical protein [Nocardia sp. NPDC003963]
MSIETYEAELDHPWATRWRIPRVHSPYPRWKFEVALCVPEPEVPNDRQLWGATEPSEEEARIVAWFINWRRTYYREHWQKKMLERPFDIDSGTNTVILVRTEGGWQYRRATFESGPWPYWNDERRSDFPATPEGLMALLDHIDWSHTWKKWRAENPQPAEGVGA